MMFSDFCSGIKSFISGVEYFFLSRRLWKYSLVPLLMTFFCNTLLVFGSFRLKMILEAPLKRSIAELPQWCRGFVEGGYDILSSVVLFLLLITFILITLPPLYELFHGLFSDSLLNEWEKENGKAMENKLSFQQNLYFFRQNMAFSLKTFLLFLLTLPIPFLLPIGGGAINWSFLAYRLGLSLILPAGFYHGEDTEKTLALSRKRRGLVLGLGIAASFSLLIPLLFPLFLPGMTVGGAIVYKKLREEEK